MSNRPGIGFRQTKTTKQSARTYMELRKVRNESAVDKTRPKKEREIGPNMRVKELLVAGYTDEEIINTILQEFPVHDHDGYTNKRGIYVKSGREIVTEFIKYWREQELDGR